jgi:predicted nucleic-acid-binding protein
MIGLDTNVLVRYIMQDDAKQTKLATNLIESLNDSSPGFVTIVSVVELGWVLESAFELSRVQVAEALQNLIAVDVFKIERVAVVASAVRAFAAGRADLADYLIERSAVQAGCERTMTFDQAAAKSAGMTLVQ